MQQWRVSDLMTTDVVTTPIDTPVGKLVDILSTHRVSAVPVVGDDDRVVGIVSQADLLRSGQLLGIVSRADLLRLYTRPDTAIRQDIIEHVLRRTMWIGPTEVQVDVAAGVATLAGAVGRRTTAAIVARLTGKVPGVVAVVNNVHYDFDDTALARSRIPRTHPFSAEPFNP
jgi:CBS domain-containing protein